MAEIRAEVQADLARCGAKLDEESASDERMRAKWTGQWRRPASNVLAGPCAHSPSLHSHSHLAVSISPCSRIA